MNVIPAQAAGVGSIAITSPGQAAFGGLPHPTVLATAAILGVDEVYAVGGAGAIGALAYGVDANEFEGAIEPVDVITGPGNIYVAAAKQLVQGQVGIDAVAGPTEIGIVADETANPAFVAADLIGQAEHDPLAGSVLITDSADLAAAVLAELNIRVAATKHSERVQTALEGPQSAIVLVNDTAEAVVVANAYGAEHLEIHTANPREIAAQVTNAGAVFVGAYAPVPLGDYIGGSNHVLPTGGTSKFSSGLSVYPFLRSVQQIEYTAPALDAVTDKLVTFANAEDLPAHGEAALARRDGGKAASTSANLGQTAQHQEGGASV
jgi:histidinol dehydrogenase